MSLNCGHEAGKCPMFSEGHELPAEFMCLYEYVGREIQRCRELLCATGKDKLDIPEEKRHQISGRIIALGWVLDAIDGDEGQATVGGVLKGVVTYP